jgi:hypothetical protein
MLERALVDALCPYACRRRVLSCGKMVVMNVSREEDGNKWR